MRSYQPKQSGFTLVEIAIVLVIIGILLGGVLKGQEMVDSGRIKGLVTDMNGLSSAYNSYADRYQAIPGDELAATLTARGWTTITAPPGNADGILEAPLADTFVNGNAANNEQSEMWSVLRAAQFVGGDPSQTGTAGLQKSATGGYIGVTTSPYGMSGTSICLSGLTTKQAAGVDAIIDGPPKAGIGNNVGSFRGIDNAAAPPLTPTLAAPAATAYNEVTVVNPWTMCRTL